MDIGQGGSATTNKVEFDQHEVNLASLAKVDVNHIVNYKNVEFDQNEVDQFYIIKVDLNDSGNYKLSLI